MGTPAGEIDEVLFTADQISTKVRDLAAQLVARYTGKNPLLVGILNGCFPFLADLIRAMDIHLEVDFMRVASYEGTESSGVVRILKDLDAAIDGRHVLLVEDIVDTGLTLGYLLDNLRARHPASVRVCALLDKRAARQVKVDLDYVGFECPERFVVGYGLDHAGRYRNLPFVGVLPPG